MYKLLNELCFKAICSANLKLHWFEWIYWYRNSIYEHLNGRISYVRDNLHTFDYIRWKILCPSFRMSYVLKKSVQAIWNYIILKEYMNGHNFRYDYLNRRKSHVRDNLHIFDYIHWKALCPSFWMSYVSKKSVWSIWNYVALNEYVEKVLKIYLCQFLSNFCIFTKKLKSANWFELHFLSWHHLKGQNLLFLMI